jgi:predicted DCC family thiol-disulfide oxidoreductase YuxK
VAADTTDRTAPIVTGSVTDNDAGKVAVYYNSACPVCRCGIEWQQGQTMACEIEWIDVQKSSDAVTQIDADIESVRERLHVRDAQGRVLIGADAVAFVMERTPGRRWLGRFAALSIIRPAMRWAYDAFARVLYRWNRGKGRW